MTVRAVDLFAGWGGFTLGAEEAGARVVWAGNHNRPGVGVHQLNHPHVTHVCQDLRQADWTDLPDYELLLAGPACQGHSEAGKPSRKKSERVRAHHDSLRGTAWSVVECADITRPKHLVVENVPPFAQWTLFPVWCDALSRLGYHLQVFRLWATRFGVPQRRQRLFIIGSLRPLRLRLSEAPPEQEPAFGPCLISTEEDWRPISEAKPAARARMERALRNYGPLCLSQHVTNHPGVPLNEPIRTITTAPQHWALVDGRRRRYRYLSGRELARGMGFPDSFRWPDSMATKDITRGLGNAVPPPLAHGVVREVLMAA